MNQSNPYQSNYTNSDRTNPEINIEREALDSVRNVRATGPSKGGIASKFNLSMPVKISAIALVFAGIVLSVWTMKSSRSFMDDDDLPTIANDFGASAFKVEPGEEDAIQVPHSDKEFYSELEPAKPTQNKEELRAAPEAPSEQVSQEALFVEASKVPEMAILPEGREENEEPQASDISSRVVESSSNSKSVVDVKTVEKKVEEVTVVEAANDTPETYKAPAPTVSLNKPRKTLEMAIDETQRKIHRTASALAHDRSLSKDQSAGGKVVVKKDVVTQVTSPKMTVAVSTPTPKKTQAVSSVIATTTASSGARAYWVQIASLPTQAAAQKEWVRLQGKAPKTLKGQNYNTVRVDLGKPKGIRYRVHVGPFSKAQAVQKCQNLKGANLGCLVIKRK
jgi:hypothetical protein